MKWAAAPEAMPNPDSQPQPNAEQQPSGQPQSSDKAAPSGQPQPPSTSATTHDSPAFGWSAYAERINGRFAMLGFVAVLLIEALSGDNFLHWAGLVP
jgi:hypothetical protein